MPMSFVHALMNSLFLLCRLLVGPGGEDDLLVGLAVDLVLAGGHQEPVLVVDDELDALGLVLVVAGRAQLGALPSAVGVLGAHVAPLGAGIEIGN